MPAFLLQQQNKTKNRVIRACPVKLTESRAERISLGQSAPKELKKFTFLPTHYFS